MEALGATSMTTPLIDSEDKNEIKDEDNSDYYIQYDNKNKRMIRFEHGKVEYIAKKRDVKNTPGKAVRVYSNVPQMNYLEGTFVLSRFRPDGFISLRSKNGNGKIVCYTFDILLSHLFSKLEHVMLKTYMPKHVDSIDGSFRIIYDLLNKNIKSQIKSITTTLVEKVSDINRERSIKTTVTKITQGVNKYRLEFQIPATTVLLAVYGDLMIIDYEIRINIKLPFPYNEMEHTIPIYGLDLFLTPKSHFRGCTCIKPTPTAETVAESVSPEQE